MRPRFLSALHQASNLYRVVNDERGLQADFMPAVHGVRSFNSLRARAGTVELAGARLRVAHLADIIASKRAAGRPRDQAVLEVLERTLREKEKTPPQS